MATLERKRRIIEWKQEGRAFYSTNTKRKFVCHVGEWPSKIYQPFLILSQCLGEDDRLLPLAPEQPYINDKLTSLQVCQGICESYENRRLWDE